MDKDKKDLPQNEPGTQEKQEESKPRTSAFNEPGPEIQKSTSNTEAADLEQERKDAMTERD